MLWSSRCLSQKTLIDKEPNCFTHMGCAFGGFKTRTDVPRLVDQHLAGKLPIDHFISHTLKGVERTNEAIHILESGECLRCVVIY